MIIKRGKKWQKKLSDERFRRRRHCLGRKATELSERWNDVDVLFMIRKKKQYYIFNSVEDDTQMKSWPIGTQKLVSC